MWDRLFPVPHALKLAPLSPPESSGFLLVVVAILELDFDDDLAHFHFPHPLVATFEIAHERLGQVINLLVRLTPTLIVVDMPWLTRTRLVVISLATRRLQIWIELIAQSPD